MSKEIYYFDEFVNMKEKINVIERWIGVDPKGDLNRKEAVEELINDIPGLKAYMESQGEQLSSDKKRVAICVGHSELDKGAVSYRGVWEWNSRKVIAEKVKHLLNTNKIYAEVFFRNPHKGYSAAMKELGTKIDNFKADLAIELHFNSFDGEAHGAEFLCVSSAGEKLAKCFVESWKKHYPSIKLRRDNGVFKISGGNGYGFLTSMKCPACLLEPEFADNPEKWPVIANSPDKEALAIYDAITLFLK